MADVASSHATGLSGWRAPRWLPGGNAQTIWPALWSRRPPDAPWRRERWDTPDGDFVDVDWLDGMLNVERGIVRQHVDDVKTVNSHGPMSIDHEMLEILKTWKQTTQFCAPEDWMFASPVQIGRLPWSYPMVLRVFHRAASDAGIGHLSTHTMRHTYRSWLDAVKRRLPYNRK